MKTIFLANKKKSLSGPFSKGFKNKNYLKQATYED